MFVRPGSADCAAAASTSADDLDALRQKQAQFAALLVTPDMEDDALALAQARRMLHFIDTARTVFPGLRELADHPGWEIMLQVFVAGCEGRAVTTGDLCDITGCWRPLTVRYVELLIERGMIAREIAADHPAGTPDHHGLRVTPDTAVRFRTLLCGYARGWAAPPGLN